MTTTEINFNTNAVQNNIDFDIQNILNDDESTIDKLILSSSEKMIWPWDKTIYTVHISMFIGVPHQSLSGHSS